MPAVTSCSASAWNRSLGISFPMTFFMRGEAVSGARVAVFWPVDARSSMIFGLNPSGRKMDDKEKGSSRSRCPSRSLPVEDDPQGPNPPNLRSGRIPGRCPLSHESWRIQRAVRESESSLPRRTGNLSRSRDWSLPASCRRIRPQGEQHRDRHGRLFRAALDSSHSLGKSWCYADSLDQPIFSKVKGICGWNIHSGHITKCLSQFATVRRSAGRSRTRLGQG